MSNAVITGLDLNTTGVWYVAADAEAQGTGLIDSPLTITEALASVHIKAGHQVILRGGVYTTESRIVNCLISGTWASPIVVSNYPGEVAEMRFGINQLGSHVHYISEDYGLLRRDVIEDRINEEGTGAPPPGQANAVGNQQADGIRVINMRVDNTMGTGFTSFNSEGMELYGLIVHDNGWEGTDRKHGPGFYGANESVTVEKLIENCIMLNTFTGGMQLGEGSSSGNPANKMTVRDSTLAGCNLTQATTRGDNILLDSVWQQGPYNLSLGLYYTGEAHGSAVMSDCITDTPVQFVAYKYQSLDIQNNVFTAATYINTEVDGGEYTIQNNQVVVSGVYTQVIPNTYAARFATLRVFDFDETGSVTVDVSAFAASGTLRVRNPMLWNGSENDEYLDLTVTDGEITLPMTGWTTPPPTGWAEPFNIIFSARFGVFILEKPAE